AAVALTGGQLRSGRGHHRQEELPEPVESRPRNLSPPALLRLRKHPVCGVQVIVEQLAEVHPPPEADELQEEQRQQLLIQVWPPFVAGPERTQRQPLLGPAPVTQVVQQDGE